MRLLVLDQSHILPWIVERELPSRSGVEVVSVTRLRDAERILREAPPDAAIVSLTPSHVDWRTFQVLCREHRPPIPILFESCVDTTASDLGFDPRIDGVLVLPKPAPARAIRDALLRLLELAEGPPILPSEPPTLELH